MKIEILYPELCTLYGDKGNMQYLKLCLPDAEFVETTLNAKPLFLTEDIDLVYMCSMSEKSQEVILSRLLPLKEEIFRAFDADSILLRWKCARTAWQIHQAGRWQQGGSSGVLKQLFGQTNPEPFQYIDEGKIR